MRKKMEHLTGIRKVTFFFCDDTERRYPRACYVDAYADVLGKINKIEDHDTKLHWYRIYDRAMDAAAIRTAREKISWKRIIIEKVERLQSF